MCVPLIYTYIDTSLNTHYHVLSTVCAEYIPVSNRLSNIYLDFFLYLSTEMWNFLCHYIKIYLKGKTIKFYDL